MAEIMSKTKETYCSLTNMPSYFLSNFQNKLQLYFDSLPTNPPSPKFIVKKFLKLENGSKSRGDFSIHSSPLRATFPYRDLIQLCVEIKSHMGDVVEQCDLRDNIIQFRLNRKLTYETVIKDVLSSKSSYGRNIQGNNRKILLVKHVSSADTLLALRNTLLYENVTNILEANEYQIYCDADISRRNSKIPISLNNVLYYNCTDCPDSENVDSLVCKAMNSKWRLENSTLPQSQSHNVVDFVVIDGERYLKEKYDSSTIRKSYKNLGILPVKTERVTSCLIECARLVHMLTHHASCAEMVLHIAPDREMLTLKQAGLLYEMLCDSKKVPQYYLSHQNVKVNNDLTSDSYIDIKIADMKTALSHKYGADILNDLSWVTTLKHVVNAVVKFDMLSTNSSSLLTINMERQSQERRGAFVQYNCARLSMLLKHHKEKVENGEYPPLPKMDDVNFGLLKLEEEWMLFLGYVVPFPEVVGHLVDDFGSFGGQVALSTNKVCQMLLNASKDLSIYYNKNRVLTEQSNERLLNVMAVRLYMLKSLYQVMRNAMVLLGLETVDKM